MQTFTQRLRKITEFHVSWDCSMNYAVPLFYCSYDFDISISILLYYFKVRIYLEKLRHTDCFKQLIKQIIT